MLARTGIVRRAVRMLREEGIRSVWYAFLERTIYRRIMCIERPLSEPVPEAKSDLNLVIGFLRDSEVNDYVGFYSKTNASEVRGRLNNGDMCVVVRHEGQIVSSAWASNRRAPVEYLGREISLGPGEAYVYDVFTAPSLRGRNISPTRSAWMLHYFQEAGYKRLIGAIVPENKSSLSASRKVGYRPFAVIGYFRLGPLRWDFQHRLTPNHGELSVSSVTKTS